MPLRECLAPEDIAAFLDRTAGEEARRRVVEHLAECATCYELFAETARSLQESSSAVAEHMDSRRPDRRGRSAPTYTEGALGTIAHPFSRRYGRRALGAMAVAALLLVAVAVPLLLQRATDRGAAAPALDAGLLAGRATGGVNPAVAVGYEWNTQSWHAFRGGAVGAVGDEQTSFRLGVLIIDMEVALQSDEFSAAARTAVEIADLLSPPEAAGGTGTPPGLGQPEARDYRGIAVRLTIARWLSEWARPLVVLAELLPGRNPVGYLAGRYRTRADLIIDQASVLAAAAEIALADLVPEPRVIELGKWAEAARLAARLNNRQYLSSPDVVAALQLFRDTESNELVRRRLEDVAGAMSVEVTEIQELRDALDALLLAGGGS